MSRRRTRPSAPPSRLAPAILAAAIVVAGFVTLMIRLEITQEGYRLSTLRLRIRDLENRNQQLRLELAELESRPRLRALAPRYGLAPASPAQVVVMP